LDSYYYIKRESIIERIPFGNRTFYSRLERIDKPLTPLLLSQHLKREYTIVSPLLKDGKTDYLLFVYTGEAYQRFFYLIQHLLQMEQIVHYQIYQGRHQETIQVFIPVEQMALKEAELKVTQLSAKLEKRLTKEWKTLPSSALPESYNSVTLPYKRLL